MSARLNYFEAAPALGSKLMDLSQTSAASSIGKKILDLINIRVAQLNACAFCLDMHVKEAKIHGERELRIYHLPIWRESNLFDEKERAALEWTEALTKLNPHGISNELFEKTRKMYSEKELAELTYAIGIINLWTRMNAAFKSVPGSLDEQFGLTRAALK